MGGVIVAGDDQRRAQAMSQRRLRLGGQQGLDLAGSVAAVRMEQEKRACGARIGGACGIGIAA
jgi:hypothetical protein